MALAVARQVKVQAFQQTQILSQVLKLLAVLQTSSAEDAQTALEVIHTSLEEQASALNAEWTRLVDQIEFSLDQQGASFDVHFGTGGDGVDVT
jgi:hypothetical protein